MFPLQKLKELRDERQITQTEIANALHITQKAYSYYERGEREPSIQTLIEIANYFNISIDHLLCRETDNYYALNSQEKRIIEKYKKLNDINKIRIEERIDTLNEVQAVPPAD